MIDRANIYGYEPELKVALNESLGGPRPHRAQELRLMFNSDDWTGILKRVWPQLRYVACTPPQGTGTLSSTLHDMAGEDVTVYSPLYVASEGCFGLNINPLKHGTPQYVLDPRHIFFEFLESDATNATPVVR